MGIEGNIVLTVLAAAGALFAYCARKGLYAPVHHAASTPSPAPGPGPASTPRLVRPVALDASRLRALAVDFFKDKRCSMCGLAIAEPPLVSHPAALRGPDGTTIEWTQVPPADLEIALKTHAPVCWNCHLAEEFRRMYPELVTDRPEHVSVIH